MSPLDSISKSIEHYQPKFLILKKGTKIFRISYRHFSGIALNPHHYADDPGFDPILNGSRFSPFKAKNGKWVPSSYVGQSEQVAVGEVLLRNMPKMASYFSITLDQLSGLRMFELSLREDLNFVRLRGLGLRALGLRNVDVIGLPQPAYPETQAFAKAIYNHSLVKKESTAGMVWTSRQVDDGWAALVWSRNLPNQWADETSGWDLDANHNRSKIEEILSQANVALV